MTDHRCSSLPLFMKCGQSMLGDMAIKEWFPEAELGTAAHVGAALVVRGEPVDADAIAVLYGVDKGELGPLVAAAVRAWAELGRTATGNLTSAEVPLEAVFGDVKLTGTADVIILADGQAVTVIDWKTGRRDSDYREQVLGYCALALEAFPTVATAFAKLVWLRTDEVEAYSLTRADLPAWKERFLKQVNDTAYRAGEHCRYCPRKFACPAREEMSRSAIAIMGDGIISGTGPRSLRELPVEQQVALYRKAKAVGGMAADVISEMRALVTEQGPITALGTHLEIVEETRRNLNTEKAWPVLQKYLTDQQIANVVVVQSGKAEDAVGESVPRGEKGARRRAFTDALEAAGAVSHSTIKKLMERRR